MQNKLWTSNSWVKAAAAVIALLLWQLLSVILNQRLLLVSPIKVIIRLSTIWMETDFVNIIVWSSVRIVVGFFAGFISGIVLGALAGRYKMFEIFMWPYVTTVKTVPVASFIIIALIWLSSGQLSAFISFLMVFPIIYSNILTGIKNTDIKLIQMSQVFRLTTIKKIMYIYIPQLKPYIMSSCSTALGIAWKAGIAAEIIGIPSGSIGDMLYTAKIYFDTADLFAWTAIIVIVSVVFEKMFIYLLKISYMGLEKL